MWMFGSRTTVKKVRNLLTWFSHNQVDMYDDDDEVVNDMITSGIANNNNNFCISIAISIVNAAFSNAFFICLCFTH